MATQPNLLPKPKSPVDNRFKPEFSNLSRENILTELTFLLITTVFTNPKANYRFALSLYALNRLQKFEIRDASKIEWAAFFVTEVIERDIELYFWLLCDPRTSQVESYSVGVRDLLKEKGVTFPGLSSKKQKTTQFTVEVPEPITSPRSSTENESWSLLEETRPHEAGINRERKYIYCFITITIVLAAMLAGKLVLVVVLAFKDLHHIDGREIHINTGRIEIGMHATSPVKDKDRLLVAACTVSPIYIKNKTTLTSESSSPKVENKTKPRHIIKLKNAFDYGANLVKIGNDNIEKLLELYEFSSHTYTNLNFDCGPRIDGLRIHKSSLYIDEVVNMLKKTKNIKILQIYGSEISYRRLQEDFRRNNINENVQLKKLRHLEFNNLIDPTNSNADCKEVFDLFASDVIVYSNLISMSFSLVNFTRRNSLDLNHLISKGMESESFANLGIFNSSLSTEMFNQEVKVRRHLSEVLINVVDNYSTNAQLSLLNLLNTFLYFSTCDTFKTNIVMPLGDLQKSIPSINRLRLHTLVLRVYVNTCDNISLGFIEQIKTVENLKMKLVFTNKCVNLSQETPIFLTGLQSLNNTKVLSRIQIASNANVRAVGVSDLFCRDFRKTLRKLTLHRHVC